jgi:transcriptional regulator with XRE-family HTH domain
MVGQIVLLQQQPAVGETRRRSLQAVVGDTATARRWIAVCQNNAWSRDLIPRSRSWTSRKRGRNSERGLRPLLASPQGAVGLARSASSSGSAPAVIPLRRALGRVIRELRASHGLSIAALAASSGWSDSQIRGIENGERNPTLAYLAHLSGSLGVRLSDLLIAGGATLRRRIAGRRACFHGLAARIVRPCQQVIRGLPW